MQLEGAGSGRTGDEDAEAPQGAGLEAAFAGGMPDLQALLQQASAMQERLVDAQHELEDARVEGSSGGGLVHATVTGTGELIGLTIDPSVCDPDDPETLADLVVAAVQNAVDTAHRQATDAMAGVSGGFGGDLGAGFAALTGQDSAEDR